VGSFHRGVSESNWSLQTIIGWISSKHIVSLYSGNK
jgi:hypothetical protein